MRVFLFGQRKKKLQENTEGILDLDSLTLMSATEIELEAALEAITDEIARREPASPVATTDTGSIVLLSSCVQYGSIVVVSICFLPLISL